MALNQSLKEDLNFQRLHVGLSSFLLQPHEIPISLPHSRLNTLTATRPTHFLPPEMGGHINLILARSIFQLFYLHQDLTLFSAIQNTFFPNEGPALWEMRPKFAHRSCHSLRYSKRTITRDRSRSWRRSTESSLWVPISVQIQADSASVARHSPNFLCTSNFLLSCAYPLAITMLRY